MRDDASPRTVGDRRVRTVTTTLAAAGVTGSILVATYVGLTRPATASTGTTGSGASGTADGAGAGAGTGTGSGSRHTSGSGAVTQNVPGWNGSGGLLTSPQGAPPAATSGGS